MQNKEPQLKVYARILDCCVRCENNTCRRTFDDLVICPKTSKKEESCQKK